MKLRLAERKDADALSKLDRHIKVETIMKSIDCRQIIVAVTQGQIIGLIRYNLFWDLIPFMNLIIINEDKRRKGIGTELILYYERHLRELGYQKCLTSTMSNETAQHFYRKNGYRDIGGFVLPNESLEIVLFKEL